MDIYINITNYCMTKHKTGIQRVVNCVISNLLTNEKKENISIKLLSKIDNENFVIVSAKDFYERELKNSKESIHINEIPERSIYLEMDAGWHNSGVEELYIKLKRNNVKIVALVYDVIPFLKPDLFMKNVLYSFISYIKNVLHYSDLILVSANKVKNDINKLSEVYSIESKRIEKIKFGYDFSNFEKETTEENSEISIIREEIPEIISKGKYLIMVGTIEPRKNHRVVIDAFEESLFSKGFNLVIIGKRGWNNKPILSKIKGSKYFETQLFLLEGISDQELEILYKNSLFTIQSSIDEGFGLPIIEAVVNKIPIIASDIDTFKEITENKVVYFNNEQPTDLVNKVLMYSSKEKYNEILEKQGQISLFTWQDSTDDLIRALRENFENKIEDISNDRDKILLGNKINKGVKQVVLLTNRPEVVNTLNFIENLMLFVEEIVIATPQKTISKIQESYKGTLKLTFISDEILLDGRELPEDHQVRNLFLRKLLIQRDEINENFIMYDDDYRPLKLVDESFFIENNKYNIYYFHNLNEWYPYSQEYTSFDLGALRSLEFAKANNTTMLQFDSHMPQIMNKSVWLEIINLYPDANTSEWNLYFNYLYTHYKEFCNLEVFKTLAWPDKLRHWGEYYVEPTEFIFENYYNKSYEESGMFEGLSTEFSEQYLLESNQKIALFKENVNIYMHIKRAKHNYINRYKVKHGTKPSFALFISEEKVELITPNYFENYSLNSLKEELGESMKDVASIPVKVRFKILNKVVEKTKLTIIQNLYKDKKRIRTVKLDSHLYPNMEYFSIPMFTSNIRGKYRIELCIQVEDRKYITSKSFTLVAY